MRMTPAVSRPRLPAVPPPEKAVPRLLQRLSAYYVGECPEVAEKRVRPPQLVGGFEG